jgi:signal peptidase II
LTPPAATAKPLAGKPGGGQRLSGKLWKSDMSRMDAGTGQSWFAKIRLWGSLSFIGLAVAALSLAIDQAHKYWMIEVYRIAERGRVQVTSFFDLIMVWNPGVSYGLLAQDGTAGRLLLIGISLAAVAVLYLWMANSSTRLVAISLGLIIGGALGNIVDRAVHGAVADFFSLHYAGFYWYVFNIADVAITAGVIGLILDWLINPAQDSASEHRSGSQ